MKPIITTLLIASFIYAETQYTEQTIKAYPSSNSNDKYQGKVLPSTKLQIKEVKGSKALVTIDGWTQNGINRVIYSSKGERIISAAFSKKAKFDLQKIKEETIKGKKWEKVSLTTWVDKKSFNKSQKEIFRKAKNLYDSNCTVCHPAPEIGHFTANQWPQIIKDMGSRTPLKKDELLLLTQYLQKHTNQANH